jgi:hypothetical protein
MSKQGGEHIPRVKKRKSVKFHSMVISDSDKESQPANISTDYVRWVKTCVTASGEVGSVTTSSILLMEEAAITNNPPLLLKVDAEDMVQDPVPTALVI